MQEHTTARNGGLPARDGSSVVRPMPRRKLAYSLDDISVALPRARRVYFQASVLRTILRLFVWVWSAARFLFGNAADLVMRRDSEQRRAVRLRHIFEDAGGTFAKFGQQLSIRADILPYAYCAELSRLLDQSPAFPYQQAIGIIER